jgi:uncharacterized membrane protein (DUF373 family)
LFRLYTPANEATTGCRQGSSGYWDLKREHTLIKALVKWQMLSEQWWRLTVFQRFESAIALVLTVILGLVTLVVLYRLAVEVTNGLLLGALNPLDRAVFQAVFGEIMTVLIALEFNHTLLYVATREQSIIQIRVVLLIALLALACKFIILDLSATAANQLFGLAAVTLALGATYWLVRERDESAPGASARRPSVLEPSRFGSESKP